MKAELHALHPFRLNNELKNYTRARRFRPAARYIYRGNSAGWRLRTDGTIIWKPNELHPRRTSHAGERSQKLESQKPLKS